MRLRALWPFLLCWLAMALAVTIAGVCSTLDARQLPLDLFRRGDLHELLGLPWVWQALGTTAGLPFLVPSHYVTVLLEWRVMLPVIVFAIGLGMVWRRVGRIDYAAAGMVCLGFALVPWLLGRHLLGSVTDDTHVGPHLVVMLAGLFWCGCGGLVLSGLQLFGRRTAAATAVA